jgi:hypothetical protein
VTSEGGWGKRGGLFYNLLNVLSIQHFIRSLDQIDLGSGLLNADCTLEETEGLPTKEEDSKSENL